MVANRRTLTWLSWALVPIWAVLLARGVWNPEEQPVAAAE